MSIGAVIVAAIAGLAVGSFVGVVADRVPRKESVVSPPSHCVACGIAVRPADNIPVFSYLVLKGRCRACGVRIPARDALLEVVTAALFALVAWRAPSLWAIPAYAVLAASLVAITAIDLEHLRIPTPIVYATLTVGSPLLVVASAGTHRWPALLSALIGGAAAFLAFFALFYAVPKGIGFGDVRLSGLCGVFLGWIGYREVALGFILAFLIAGIPAVVLLAMGRVNRRTQIPFGPFLAAGTMISVLFGVSIVQAWSAI